MPRSYCRSKPVLKADEQKQGLDNKKYYRLNRQIAKACGDFFVQPKASRSVRRCRPFFCEDG